MPRLARLDAPGILHHIMIRGIERRNIFRDNKDRENFLQRLAALVPGTQSVCYAWALLPNHAHLLFRSGHSGLATLMRKLLTGYALHFNRRHKRRGQLFQNRYKSVICQEDIYFRELVRYIHLNPLRAEVVSKLEELNDYPFSGHSVLAGKTRRDWQDFKYVLKLFGRTTREARRHYLAYVEAGIGQGRREELIGGGLIRSLGGWDEFKKVRLKGRMRLKGDERILGDSAFVEKILSQANEKHTRQYELKNKGYDLTRIAERVALIYRTAPDYALSGGRQKGKVEARSLLCYWAVRELGMALSDLARRLGMTPPGVGYAVQRGEMIARESGYQLME